MYRVEIMRYARSARSGRKSESGSEEQDEHLESGWTKRKRWNGNSSDRQRRAKCLQTSDVCGIVALFTSG